MRKITLNAIKAFYNFKTFHTSNTTVTPADNISSMYLHGNNIAALTQRGLGVFTLSISACNYRTQTTKERLNGILSRLNLSLRQRKGEWYIGNTLWPAEEKVLTFILIQNPHNQNLEGTKINPIIKIPVNRAEEFLSLPIRNKETPHHT